MHAWKYYNLKNKTHDTYTDTIKDYLARKSVKAIAKDMGTYPKEIWRKLVIEGIKIRSSDEQRQLKKF